MERNYYGRRHILFLFSLLSAIVLWLYVLNSGPLTIEKKVGIVFVVPPDVAISNLVADEIVVELRGSRAFLRSLDGPIGPIKVNLAAYKYKRNKPFFISLNPSDISIPIGVEVISINPSKIPIELDRKIKKIVPVKVAMKGEIGQDHRLMKSRLTPDRVMISGPVSAMRKVARVLSTPVDLKALRGEDIIKLSVADLPQNIKLVSENELAFSYLVKPKAANKELEGVKIRFLASNRRFYSFYQHVSLSVLVPEGVKNRLKDSQVQVIADIPEGVSGKIKVKLKANLPEGIHLLRINPDIIIVDVKK